jgi:hydrogenase expression/formation protein HypC
MCLGLPLKIISINEKEAVGEMNGIKRKIRIDLIKDLSIDEYVMVHAGFAIEKIDKEQAEETMKIVNELEQVLENY